MKSTPWALIALFVHFGLCCHPASADEKQEIRSEPVSIGNGDFRLHVRDKSKVVLRHVSHGRVSESVVKPSESKSKDPLKQDSRLADGQVATISEVALARWSGASLVAVVELNRGGKFTWWCLTFRRVGLGNGDTESTPIASVLAKSDTNLRILAVSGTRNPPAITIAIGRRTKGGQIANGMIFDDWCANPAFVGAPTGIFTPMYPSAPKN